MAATRVTASLRDATRVSERLAHPVATRQDVKMQSIDHPVRVAIAIVEQNGQFLVGVRPESVPLAGFAEFPGGKVHDDETAAAAAVRECHEETGLQVVVEREFFSTCSPLRSRSA